MTYSIWKYDIPITGEDIIIDMPFGSKILLFQLQNDEFQIEIPTIWVLVQKDMPLETRVFKSYGTGMEIENTENLIYIGTVVMNVGIFVYHLFEKVKK